MIPLLGTILPSETQRLWRNSGVSEVGGAAITPHDILRFCTKIQAPKDPSDCWIWSGSFDRFGYGRFHLDPMKYTRAHRVAFVLTHRRQVGSGLVVRHICDHPACVNPAHLVEGTQGENMMDRQERGRQARGERNGRAKLTAQQVQAIRASPDSCRKLAALYGVSHGTIADIKRGDLWASLKAA